MYLTNAVRIVSSVTFDQTVSLGAFNLGFHSFITGRNIKKIIIFFASTKYIPSAFSVNKYPLCFRILNPRKLTPRIMVPRF